MRSDYTPVEIARFWAKVRRADGCWEWQAFRNQDGYGKITFRRGTERAQVNAHRIAWELTNGPIPPAMHVLHRCDNPCCCNPDHLFLGTHADNMRDKAAKGRVVAPKGSLHHSAKLTEADVLAIRHAYATRTATQIEMARRYGISKQVMWRLIHRRIWKHI